uniref:Uncharacterized protein n=1 Tax=Arundo donax TaxID=35708 RepID=A0A0A9H8J1_ARUDO
MEFYSSEINICFLANFLIS